MISLAVFKAGFKLEHISIAQSSWSNTCSWVGVVRITNVLRMAECSPVFSLGKQNL